MDTSNVRHYPHVRCGRSQHFWIHGTDDGCKSIALCLMRSNWKRRKPPTNAKSLIKMPGFNRLCWHKFNSLQGKYELRGKRRGDSILEYWFLRDRFRHMKYDKHLAWLSWFPAISHNLFSHITASSGYFEDDKHTWTRIFVVYSWLYVFVRRRTGGWII